MPPAVFSKRSRTPPGHPAAPSSVPALWVGGAGAVGLSPARTSRSIQLRSSSRVLPLVLDEGTKSSLLVCPHVHQRFVVVESRERLDDLRKRRSRWWGHDGSGVPASFPGFRHQCNKVRRKEGSGQDWLVKTQVFLLTQINSHRCALGVTWTHQLSRLSQLSLSVFVPAASLLQLVRASLHSVSLNQLPFHGGFYPVSTPITAIRHRWSSFCTWPTYLPLSPESFSRCRLRWTTPPSPHPDNSINSPNGGILSL